MLHRHLPIENFDFNSDADLEAARAQASSSLSYDQVQTLVDLPQDIRDRSETERASEDFQHRVWRDKTPWSGGPANDEGFSLLVESTDFRTWFAQHSNMEERSPTLVEHPPLDESKGDRLPRNSFADTMLVSSCPQASCSSAVGRTGNLRAPHGRLDSQ